MHETIIQSRKIKAVTLMVIFCTALAIPLAAQATADRTFTNVSALQQTGVVGPNTSGRMHTANTGGADGRRIDFFLFRRISSGSPWIMTDSTINRGAHSFTARPWRSTTNSSTQWQTRAQRNDVGTGNMSGRIFTQHAR
jgi:hypothetical protein